VTSTGASAPRRGAPIAPADPAVFVGFGATGDLTRRKLLPALVNLRRSGALSERFAFLAVVRQPEMVANFAGDVLAATAEFLDTPLSDDEHRWFAERIVAVAGDLEQPDLYTAITTTLHEVQGRVDSGGNALFYLATPPALFAPIAAGLGQAGLLDEAKAGGWRRVIIEKPFGHDLESALALNRSLSSVMGERQVYRIDHYLGKETVQNLMIFRFANSIFEPIWNRRYVDHVQITVAESDGIGTRGGYYDSAGALRDMVQNHLFMLLALTAMEPPISFEADAVRDERLKVLQAIAPFTQASVERDVVRGQYTAGRVNQEDVRGYLQEDKVAADSKTETFVALRLQVENWRWAGVPFYLRTGKRLARRVSEIAVQFRQPPFMMFRNTCVPCLNSNVLVIRVQPEEGITLHVDAKVPGQTLDLQTVAMNFKYDEEFAQPPSTGYETLLYDALTGDQTLFHRADSTEVSWRVVMPILDAWHSGNHTVPYEAGSWGPEEAHELLERDGRAWRRP
jgi:glucose-6-phosphate 1-dehydrogenase